MVCLDVPFIRAYNDEARICCYPNLYDRTKYRRETAATWERVRETNMNMESPNHANNRFVEFTGAKWRHPVLSPPAMLVAAAIVVAAAGPPLTYK